MTADGALPVGGTTTPGGTPMSQGQGESEDDENVTRPSGEANDSLGEKLEDSSLTEESSAAGSNTVTTLHGAAEESRNGEEHDLSSATLVLREHEPDGPSHPAPDQEGAGSQNGHELFDAVTLQEQEKSAAAENTGVRLVGESEQGCGNEVGESGSAGGSQVKHEEDEMSGSSSPADDYQLSVRNRFSLDRLPAAETARTQEQSGETVLNEQEHRAATGSRDSRQPLDEERGDQSGAILVGDDSGYPSSSSVQTPGTPSTPRVESTPRVSSVSRRASDSEADAVSVEGTTDENATPVPLSPQQPGVDRPFVRPGEIDLSRTEPGTNLAVLYQQKSAQFGIRPNPLLLESLASVSSTEVEENQKKSIAVACPGNMRKVFCRRLDDLGMIPAVLVLAHCGPCLQSLNLSYNRLSDHGAVSVAALLGHCQALRSLNLKGNDIKSTGTAALCESFRKYCPVLEELDVSLNPVGDSGARALADWLRDDRFLKKLSVDSCQIDMDGLIALAAVLRETNRVSVSIFRGNCPRGSSGAVLLKKLSFQYTSV